MGVITLKIDDALEERLRRRIGRSRGAERGAISQSVEEAIELWLENPEGFRSRKKRSRFVAFDGKKRVAEAESLASLSGKLREANIDPRDVSIEESVSEPRTEIKMGLRTSKLLQKSSRKE